MTEIQDTASSSTELVYALAVIRHAKLALTHF